MPSQRPGEEEAGLLRQSNRNKPSLILKDTEFNQKLETEVEYIQGTTAAGNFVLFHILFISAMLLFIILIFILSPVN